MDEDVKIYFGVVLQTYNGGAPTPYQYCLGMPGETMEQLAGRVKAIQDGLKQGGGYTYFSYLGEFTHELPGPPPPPPAKIEKIKGFPRSMTGRKANKVRAALKTITAGE
jgi:hypothetical protein